VGLSANDEIAQQIFLTDLARELSKELGVDAPSELSRVENLKTAPFDPSDPEGYIKAQVDKFGR
jgi:nitrate/nitrite transport system substrate-binding protein